MPLSLENLDDPIFNQLPPEEQHKGRREVFQDLQKNDPQFRGLPPEERRKVLFPQAEAEAPSTLQNIATGPIGAGLEAVGRGIRATPGAIVGLAKDVGKAAITPPEEGMFDLAGAPQRLLDVTKG